MSLDELCREYAVIVAEGSGVIFQPMSDEYTYILTAKHVVSEDDKDEDDNYVVVNKDEIKIKIDGIDNIIVSGVYPHSFLDIAILKINKIDKRTPLKEFEQISENDNKYHLYGFPAYKRSVKESFDKKIQDIDLKYNKVNRYEISFDNTHRIKYKGISGYSGGGVFLEKNSEVYLIGIEYAMTDMEEEAPLYRIQAVDIMAFDEIIENYTDELVPLYPPYMNDFNLLLDDIFLLNGLMIEKEKVITCLKDIAENDIKCNISPKEIHDLYKDKLLSKNEYINELLNKELWIRYFEFLVLSKLIDIDEICIENIDTIYTKRKFLFAKTNDWTSLVQEIFSYDLKSLTKNGTLCIACDIDTKPNICEIPAKVLKNINNVPRRRMKVNEAISSPIDEISIQHIHNFQRKFIENQSVLSGLNIDQIEEKVKDEARNTFRRN